MNDIEIKQIMSHELRRQEETIELIASENYASKAVLEATGSIFTNKYSEGYPGHRYYGGCGNMDEAEDLAIDRAKKLFGADHVNVQPHSGTQANLAVYSAVLKPKDIILSMDLSQGGHLSHGSIKNFSGRNYKVYSYGVDPVTERIDYDRVEQIAKAIRPRIIVAGFSAYSRELDFVRFSKIAKKVNAYLLSDIAHVAGLVASTYYPSPVVHSDFVTTTTHKTLRGPRGAIIMCKSVLANMVDKAVFPGMQGGPFMHSILAKAVAFGEAQTSEFDNYQLRTLSNSQHFARLMKEAEFHVVSGGTDCHMFLINLSKSKDCVTSGLEAQTILEAAGIAVNKNLVPGDRQPPSTCSGIRIGTPAVTTRGFNKPEIEKVAEWMITLLRLNKFCTKYAPTSVVHQVKKKVKSLCKNFPIYR